MTDRFEENAVMTVWAHNRRMGGDGIRECELDELRFVGKPLKESAQFGISAKSLSGGSQGRGIGVSDSGTSLRRVQVGILLMSDTATLQRTCQALG